MSFNSLKLRLLLRLYFNYFFRNCSCQYCRYNCYNYKLLQINNIIKKRKIHYETRFHNSIRRTFDQQLKEKTTKNYEDLLQ